MPVEPQITVEVILQRPVLPGYMPHFRVAEGERLGVRFVSVGDKSSDGSLRATVSLMYLPQVDYEALVPGALFNVVEGSRVVGHGRVLEGQHAI